MRQVIYSGITLCFSTSLHAQPLTPGTLTRLNVAGTEHGYILVSMPKAAAQKQPLPILFWFHGTGGQPTAQFGYEPGTPKSSVLRFPAPARYEIDAAYEAKLQRIADEMIVVGMSYPERPPGAARFPAMRIWELCRQVRDQLERQVPIDARRCYLGGFSRGGNNAFRIAIEPPNDLAGIAMFAGGVPAGYKFDPAPRFKHPFRVLICNGELDSNFWSAHIARRFFLARGAQITYDEWLGGKHQRFVASRRVIDWLMEIIEPQNHTQALISEHQAILREAVPWTRYMRLRNQLGDPRLFAADPRFPARIKAEMQSLRSDSFVKRNQQELTSFHRIVQSEIDLFHTGYVIQDSLKAIEQRYHAFAKRYPESVCLRNALQGINRIEEYRKVEMYNKVPNPHLADPNAALRQQLQQQLAQLEKQLEETKFESANQAFNRGGGRDAVRAIEFEMQKVRTALARVPRAPARGPQAPVPKSDPNFEEIPRERIAQQLSVLPETPVSPKSSPAY